MDKRKIIIESLAMDLKRVALGLQRGSTAMANRFKSEALTRAAELNSQEESVYLNKLLNGMRKSLDDNTEKTAEDALMYSTLFQNFALKRM